MICAMSLPSPCSTFLQGNLSFLWKVSLRQLTDLLTAGLAAQARPLHESDTQRRLRESADVDARVTTVYNIGDVQHELEKVRFHYIFSCWKISSSPRDLTNCNLWQGRAKELGQQSADHANNSSRQAPSSAQAGDLLVVLEIESSQICQTGYAEEPEIHYKIDQEKALAPCRVIKHVFQRTARDSPDVRFLALEVRHFPLQAANRQVKAINSPGHASPLTQWLSRKSTAAATEDCQPSSMQF